MKLKIIRGTARELENVQKRDKQILLETDTGMLKVDGLEWDEINKEYVLKRKNYGKDVSTLPPGYEPLIVNGKWAVQKYNENGEPEGEPIDLGIEAQGPQGPQGPMGPPGEMGPQGNDGKTIDIIIDPNINIVDEPEDMKVETTINVNGDKTIKFSLMPGKQGETGESSKVLFQYCNEIDSEGSAIDPVSVYNNHKFLGVATVIGDEVPEYTWMQIRNDKVMIPVYGEGDDEGKLTWRLDKAENAENLPFMDLKGPKGDAGPAPKINLTYKVSPYEIKDFFETWEDFNEYIINELEGNSPIDSYYVVNNSIIKYSLENSNWEKIDEVIKKESIDNFDGTTTYNFTMKIMEGPQGPQGPRGLQGIKGKDGTGVSILGTANLGTATEETDGTILDDEGNVIDGDFGHAYMVGSTMYVYISPNTFRCVGNIQGPQGPEGPEGPQGVKGSQGNPGPKGDKGTSVRFRGPWVTNTEYFNNANNIDIVTNNNKTYICKTTHTSGSTFNDDIINWEYIAGKGDKGDKGSDGTTTNADKLGNFKPSYYATKYDLSTDIQLAINTVLVGVDNQQYLIIEDGVLNGSSVDIEFLVIPNNVTSISHSAFANNQLTSVVIGDSVTSIGANSFYNNQLTNVVIPSSVTSIAHSAFVNNQLTSILIPSSVTSIGASAFRDNQLTNVVIPDSVTNIDNEAFHTNQLTNVVIPNSITSISYGLFQNNQLTSVVIPDSVTSIEQYAFRHNQLTSVVIPNSVTSIGNYAFANNQLTEIIFEGEIPPTIQSNTFDKNRNLLTHVFLTKGSIYVPNNAVNTYKTATNYTQFSSIIKPISERPLDYEEYAYNLFIEAGYTEEDFIVGLENKEYLIIADNHLSGSKIDVEFLVIPEGVTSIGTYALGISQMKNVVIPSSVKTLGPYAFAYNQLTSIVIPDSVTSIGKGTFYSNQLTSVIIPDNVTSINDEAFQFNQLTSVVIPNSVTTIGNSAFRNNQLTNVVIPNSVTSIGDYAFAQNELTEIIFESETPPTIQIYTLRLNPDLLTQGSIYVPDSAVETYKKKNYFSYFADIIKPISEKEGN